MSALQSKVSNRGIAPASFIQEIVAWAKRASDDIFAPNANSHDIYATVKATLGPYESLLQRRAVMLEVMRVHAGFESSWNWNEGVDVTNETSMANIRGQEAGIFQVSFDSVYLGNEAMFPFADAHDINTATKFIPAMKENHPLALEYYARLIRVSIAWAGPIKRGEILPWLKRDAVSELMALLS